MTIKKIVSERELVEISNLSYEKESEVNDTLNHDKEYTYLKEHKWEHVISSSENGSSSGYYGALFRKPVGDGKYVYVQAHRGTDFNLSGFFQDLSANVKLVLGKMPSEVKEAEAFYHRIKNTHIKEGDVLIQTGHSMGSPMAQALAIKYDHHAVTFESPGTKLALESHFMPEQSCHPGA